MWRVSGDGRREIDFRVELAELGFGVGEIAGGAACDEPMGGDGGGTLESELAAEEDAALRRLFVEKLDGARYIRGGRRDEIEHRQVAIDGMFPERFGSVRLRG